ncbi:MAG: iron uptake porin [Cyanobacteria bacterium J06638_6]
MKLFKYFGSAAIAASVSTQAVGAGAAIATEQPAPQGVHREFVSTPDAIATSGSETGEANQPEDLLGDVSAAAPLTAIVTVEALSDVAPSDWAYVALQQLVEQYGCVAGYPDGTFRGDRTITRYEFAASLEACLAVMTQLISEARVSEADIAMVQRLQAEFRQELIALETRIADLEADSVSLAANSFSTTTRLQGDAVFSLEQLIGGDQANGSGNDLPGATAFGSRARLNFNTSFTGQDLLKIRLDALSPVRLNAAVTGTNMTRLAFDRNTSQSFDIGKFFYRFPVSDRFSLQIDAARGAYQANVSSTFNPGFANPVSGAVSRFGRFNPIYYQGALGTGITGVYDLSDRLTFSAGYLSRGLGATNPSVGLFGSGYTALGQLDFRPTDQIRLGLTYARSYYPAGAVAVTAGTGSRLANAPFGNATATSANHLGLQSSIRLGRRVTLSGWAGLSLATAEANSGATVRRGDNATLLNWAMTLGLPNLGGRGNFGGLVVGQPYRVLSNDGGPDEDTGAWHLETFYRYQMSPNIAFIPGLIVLVNPENNSGNDTILVGSFRTVFRF